MDYRRKTLYFRLLLIALVAIATAATAVSIVRADVPDRDPPKGTVPNPGTQEQELANITFPAPYNVFEFVVTCAACHGGTIDQQAGHFGNWAGTAMASAARDPVFRANQIIVNNTVLALTGKDGGGNICIRCHSPNAWYSGRTDPLLGGKGDASNMEHSILMSTDDEGILCEACHRNVGGVTMKRADLDPNDPVWNMMASIDDWPHAGEPYPDGPLAGMPYGDNTLQLNDGMAYVGKYPGYVDVTVSDTPLEGTNYTGQTYGVYPDYFPPEQLPPPPDGMPATNADGQYIYYGPDGGTVIHLETPVGPPIVDGKPDYQAQSVSLEHPTYGQERDGHGEGAFITTSEFCGGCHDLTIPVLNYGMPEQRTFTEWKFSDYGDKGSADYQRCQDCHMPTMKHEYADDARVSLNPDPALSGWFPYAKDRNPEGGTAFHKFQGSNRDLPQMMKLLYPEPDLEVLGASTGNDPRIFPGMLSTRDPMYDRSQRNNEIALHDSASVELVGNPVYNVADGKWEVQVKVTNETGHRLPSGYPDGRRFFVTLEVTDQNGNLIYQSGYYDEAKAKLFTDSDPATIQAEESPAEPGLEDYNRARSNVIDATVENAVMVYEKVTATCEKDANNVPVTCNGPTPSLLNNVIIFNNSIPPKGYDYTQAREAGAKVINYTPGTWLPVEEMDRFGANNAEHWDIVTYKFDAPSTAQLNVRTELRWQTHTRPFMEHLKTSDTSTVRPEGPPSIYAFNYPLTPNYLSDVIGLDEIPDMEGNPLRDNWGGIAYAAWMQTGKGEPYMFGIADTAAAAPPAAPVVNVTQPIDPATGVPEPFTQVISWAPVPDAEGYRVWIRYGVDEATAAWDTLAIVYGTDLTSTALNVGKTYAYKVEAFNGAGYGPMSAVVVAQTGVGLPEASPVGLEVTGATESTISLVWQDQSTNEEWFRIERQDVPAGGNFYWVADLPAPDPAGANAVQWTDTGLPTGRTYNYQVLACNNNGCTAPSLPAMGSTGGPPSTPLNLTATAPNGRLVELMWQDGGGVATGFRIERSLTTDFGGATAFMVTNPTQTTYSDNTVLPDNTYYYRVIAYNFAGESAASNVVMVVTASEPPLAPTNLSATLTGNWDGENVGTITLNWTDNANNELGFTVERANGTGPGLTWVELDTVPPNQTTYVDPTTARGQTYSYRVLAYNNGGVSATTNEAVIITPGEAPEAPSELRARASKTSVTLTWRDNATNEEGYEIWHSTDGVNFTLAGTAGVDATSYRDRNLSRNTLYFFQVRAYNNQGTQFSAWSETISVRTRR